MLVQRGRPSSAGKDRAVAGISLRVDQASQFANGKKANKGGFRLLIRPLVNR